MKNPHPSSSFPRLRELRFGHGFGIKVKRIEHETEDEISFTVAEPASKSFDGVVTLRRTAEVWK